MSEAKNWKEFEKELNFTEEETIEMELEKQLIETIMEAREKSKKESKQS